MELKFEVNTQEIVDKVLERVKDEFIPKSVIEDIKADIDELSGINSAYYIAIEDVKDIIDKHISGKETWNGYHGQITAPKGTFEKIYEDAESEDKE